MALSALAGRRDVPGPGAKNIITRHPKGCRMHAQPTSSPSIRTLAAGSAFLLAVALVLPAQGQNWQTVDDWPSPEESLGNPALSASSADIAADAWGKLFAVGSGTWVTGDPLPDGFGLVRASAAASAGQPGTWLSPDPYAGPNEEDWRSAHYRGVTRDPASGRILVVGELRPRTSYDPAWLVRESADGGATWVTTDLQPNLDGSTWSSCADIQVDPRDGTVYAVGRTLSSVNNGWGQSTWIVRRRKPTESAFTTVDRIVQTTAAEAWQVAFHPDLGVVVVGATEAGRTSSPGWTVRTSLHGEPGTWVTRERFVDSKEWLRSVAQAAMVTPGGTLYVAGSAYNAKTGKNHWMVRTSTDGGITWAISDNVVPAGSDAMVTGLALLGLDRPVACGYARDASGALRWWVRCGTPGTTWVGTGKNRKLVNTVLWESSEGWLPAGWQETRANGIAVDPSGNVFVSGRARDNEGLNHWIVRKLTP